MRRWGRWFIASLIGLLALGACGDAGSLRSITAPAAQGTRTSLPVAQHKLFYIGLALYAESWSENDVVELADELGRTSEFELVPLIASNFRRDDETYPLASDTVIAGLVNTAAERAGPGDVVMVHISTHGARGVLARQVGERPPTALTAAELARQLAPLGDRRTVIIISACYSGSLIGDLRSPHRIIITAARADRSSFGCGAGNVHTFFGEAEMTGFAEGHRSLREIVADIREHVAGMEREKRYMPSEPQVSVGADVTDLYDAAVF